MASFPKPVQNLIAEFQKIPGIGPKAAERYVYFLVNQDPKAVLAFAEALQQMAHGIYRCSECALISSQNPCHICANPKRDRSMICVVAQFYDQLIVEKTGTYHGLYHILGGMLNPLEGITPDKLHIKMLVERIKKSKPEEIFMAFDQDIEGEQTTLYLSNLLRPRKIKVSRLARGVPTGANLEYMDDITLANSFARREYIQ